MARSVNYGIGLVLGGLIITAIISRWLYASPVVLPGEFTANSTLSSSQFNQINSSFTQAINDNDRRITAIEDRLDRLDALPREQGLGRPGATRYGRSSGVLCQGVDNIVYGLSKTVVTWGAAAAACPENTWVCRRRDLPVVPCDTDRPQDTDGYSCLGEIYRYGPSTKRGWIADTFGDSADGAVATESTASSSPFAQCNMLPVWCCSAD